jgi:hypothetical protein
MKMDITAPRPPRRTDEGVGKWTNFVVNVPMAPWQPTKARKNIKELAPDPLVKETR